MKLELPECNYCPICGGPVRVIHCEGRPRPVCARCGHVIYANPYPAACLAVIRDSRILLTLRGIEPHYGEWCLPGGFLEWGESPEEGARRELLEETNLSAGRITLIGAYDSITGTRRHVLLLGYLVREWTGEPVAGDDASALAWYDLDDMPPLAFPAHAQVIADIMRLGVADAGACN